MAKTFIQDGTATTKRPVNGLESGAATKKMSLRLLPALAAVFVGVYANVNLLQPVLASKTQTLTTRENQEQARRQRRNLKMKVSNLNTNTILPEEFRNDIQDKVKTQRQSSNENLQKAQQEQEKHIKREHEEGLNGPSALMEEDYNEDEEDDDDLSDFFDNLLYGDGSPFLWDQPGSISRERDLEESEVFSCYPKMRYTHDRSKWQEENIERHWCMTVRSKNNRVRLRHCMDKRHKWEFRKDGTIRPSKKNDYCLTRKGMNDKGEPSVYLTRCEDFSKSADKLPSDAWTQQYRIKGDPDKFAMIQTEPGEEPACVSSMHHPRDWEYVQAGPCSKTKRDRTTYWRCDE